MNLDKLEFTPRCRCGNTATAFLQIHRLDYCTQSQPTCDDLYCQPCLERDITRLVQVLLDHPDSCSTCFLPIVSLSDIIVRLSPLERVTM